MVSDESVQPPADWVLSCYDPPKCPLSRMQVQVKDLIFREEKSERGDQEFKGSLHRKIQNEGGWSKALSAVGDGRGLPDEQKRYSARQGSQDFFSCS